MTHDLRRHRHAVPFTIIGLVVITIVDLIGAVVVRLQTGEVPAVLGDVSKISVTALASTLMLVLGARKAGES